MKVMILAAGRGERMRPMTDRLPKPLIEVGGKPLIRYHLERLASAGLSEIVINVSYLGDQIIRYVGDGSQYGVRVRYSRETEPLETAGGIAAARHLLGVDDFLLVNADIHTNYDFGRLAQLRLGDQLGHLVMVPNPAHHMQGDFSFAGGRIGDNAGPRLTYSGISLLAPRIVDGVPPGTRAALGPLMMHCARAGRLNGELHDGLWSDVGTPERLAGLERQLAGLRSRGDCAF
jgi:MurNAc alpha-1-phosphate uridylyltransferase